MTDPQTPARTPDEPPADKSSRREALVRPVEERPRWTTIVWRSAVVIVATAVSLNLLALILPGLRIDAFADALLAGLVLGVFNALVWPAASFVVVRLSVLTLGVGAVVLEVLAMVVMLQLLPGVEIDNWWTAALVVVGLAVISALVSAALAIDDDAWFDQRMLLSSRGSSLPEADRSVPGLVMVQIDGLSLDVLHRALGSGDVPTLYRWLREDSHRLIGWETGWSSQTGVSQCGILHGTVTDMPAFRWIERRTGRLVVSNRPESARYIEQTHSDGNGLLAHHGSSYGNLFTGDAERSVMTMSVAGRRKEGRIGAGYRQYFSKPQQVVRTIIGVVVEVLRERRAAMLQRRRDVQPRVPRTLGYAFLRAFTTVIARDVCVQGVIDDIAQGRARIYVNLVGYDEVAHHSGPERADALAVLRDIDEQIRRIQRSFRWAPRPYRIVVLSDHGQTQGETFAQRNGVTLEEFVESLAGAAVVSGDPDAEEGKTESAAWVRHGVPGSKRGEQREELRDRAVEEASRQVPTVLASGGLGLIYLPTGAGRDGRMAEPARRWTWEDIDEEYPRLIKGLVAHRDVGFVLVRSAERGSVVLGSAGRRWLETGEIEGEDPLADYGERAAEHVAATDAYPSVADIMVNARYDPELDQMPVFEKQAGAHGALGGPQNRPVLLYPADLAAPQQPILTSVSVHHVLKSWLAELGQP